MKVGALNFIDTLKVELQNELQQDPTAPREAKIQRSAKKLHQLYALELNKRQGQSLLIVLNREGALELIEVLLLMGFDNTDLAPLLLAAKDKNLMTLLIKKYGLQPYLFKEAQEGFNVKHYIIFNQHILYKEYLASFFQNIFMEAFNQHLPVSNEKRLAVIISDYVGFGFDLSHSQSNLEKILALKDYYSKNITGNGVTAALIKCEQDAFINTLINIEDLVLEMAKLSAKIECKDMEERIQLRDKLLKPLIDYCNSHFLDFEARQVLNKLLDEKKIFSTDIERDLDVLLENQVHWSKLYYCSLLLARINVQQETHNAIANERKRHIISALEGFTNSRIVQYRQQCESYYTLHKRYEAFNEMLKEDYLRLEKNFKAQDWYLTFGGAISIVLVFMQTAVVIALSLTGAGFAGLGCTFVLFVCLLLITSFAPRDSFAHLSFEAIPLFSYPNLEVTTKNSTAEEDNLLQLEQLKVNYESIQTVSVEVASKRSMLEYDSQHYERLDRKQIASVQVKYNQQLKFLLGLASFSTAALALGIVGICLSNPVIFIGLTAGAAVSTLSAAYGLFKRVQYSLPKATRVSEPNAEPLEMLPVIALEN